MVDPVSIYSGVKVLLNLAKAAGNVELQEKVVELSSSLLELAGDNASLHAQVKELHDKLSVQAAVSFHDGAYWKGESGPPENGPFCSKCWDDERKLLHMIPRSTDDDGVYYCPKCMQQVGAFPEKVLARQRERDRLHSERPTGSQSYFTG